MYKSSSAKQPIDFQIAEQLEDIKLTKAEFIIKKTSHKWVINSYVKFEDQTPVSPFYLRRYNKSVEMNKFNLLTYIRYRGVYYYKK